MTIVRFLTWNMHKMNTPEIEGVLTELVQENNIDVVILQEASGAFINTALRADHDELPYPKGEPGKGVRIFLRRGMFDHDFVDYTPMRKLVFVQLRLRTGVTFFNLAAVHLHSKRNNTERQQQWKNMALMAKLGEYEKRTKNPTHTILAGDLNANPYESNLLDPYLLRGQSDRLLIKQLDSYPVKAALSKQVLGFWYNPMWNLLGDVDARTGNPRPTGTYFRHTEAETVQWSLLDGFLVRPALMNQIVHAEVAIISRTQSTELLRPDIDWPNKTLFTDLKKLSDHLPVKFSLTLN